MRKFELYFTYWNDETNKFQQDSVVFKVNNKPFTEMFISLISQYNYYCSEHFYDIIWICGISEVNGAA